MLVALAQEQINATYVWGGVANPPGFDCSGLMQFCCYQLGIRIPRSAITQWLETPGQQIAYASYDPETGQVGEPTQLLVKEMRPGDLVFLKTSESSRHVGMVVEEGGRGIVHASYTERRVVEDSINPDDVNYNPIWAEQFIGLCRPNL